MTDFLIKDCPGQRILLSERQSFLLMQMTDYDFTGLSFEPGENLFHDDYNIVVFNN